MRILAPVFESYPAQHPASFILMHQSMALEDMGHEVHLFNITRPLYRLADYLEAYEFDLVYLDLEVLRSADLLRTLREYRRKEPIHLVAAMYALPPPPDEAWEIVDFAVTPWQGRTVEALSGKADVRYLPLGYNSQLHRRETDLPPLGPVFVGNSTGARQAEAEERLKNLSESRLVLCIGPGFEQKYLDPFMLGRVYAAARCLPNFHYRPPDEGNWMLNERFWQAARCGIPVNDFLPLMADVWDKVLLESFCYSERNTWYERVRSLHAGDVTVKAALLQHLDHSLEGHSYRDRMRQLLAWLA
jgi:hypothetical protein